MLQSVPLLSSMPSFCFQRRLELIQTSPLLGRTAQHSFQLDMTTWFRQQQVSLHKTSQGQSSTISPFLPVCYRSAQQPWKPHVEAQDGNCVGPQQETCYVGIFLPSFIQVRNKTIGSEPAYLFRFAISIASTLIKILPALSFSYDAHS